MFCLAWNMHTPIWYGDLLILIQNIARVSYDTSAVFYNILEPVKFGTQSWAVYRDKSDPVYQCIKDNKHIYKEMIEGFIYVSEQYYKTERRKQEIRKYGWNKIKPILEEIAS